MSGLTPKLPLSVDKIDGHYTLVKSYQALVKQNFKNLILTSPGERMMIPDFGVGIRRFLFENDDIELRDTITTRIQTQVRKYMPFLQIKKIDFNSYADDLEGGANMLLIQIFYNIPSLQIADILELSSTIN